VAVTMPGAQPGQSATTAYVYGPDGSRLKKIVPDKILRIEPCEQS
jgi:hypothetical protein